MEEVVSAIKNFLREDEAVTAIEYALIGALVSVIIIVAVTLVGTNLNIKYQSVVTATN